MNVLCIAVVIASGWLTIGSWLLAADLFVHGRAEGMGEMIFKVLLWPLALLAGIIGRLSEDPDYPPL